jgi:predicted ATPase/DNA-binding CsgD family transcriptional regulator
LPARRTRLIGREAELATIRTAVTEADGRLVTLTGPGGVGKSVLALEVARSLVDGPPDRWLAELAAVDDGEQLDQALCATLGLVDPSREAAELLIDVLSARDALLVLDNCEHLLPAVARLVDRLLERCPDLRILATSRRPIRVIGESVQAVPPLATSTPIRAGAAKQARPSAAVELFVARAQAARADFELTEEASRAVETICRRVEGIPLAIELAAAQVATLTPSEIDERLGRERPLSQVERRGPARQQTMESALAWSLDILEEGERRLFQRLAIFVGGWSLEAAEQVCAVPGDPGIEARSVHELLRTLVDNSLVVRSEVGPASRFRFLAPIAEQARARLVASGEEDAVALSHAHWALATASLRLPGRSHATPRDLDRIALEYDNCLGALRWAERSRIVPVVLGLDAALMEFWRVRGLLREGLGHLERAFELLGPDPSPIRPRVLLGLANLGQQVGDLDQARPRALAALAETGDGSQPIVRRTSFGVLGDIEADRGDFNAARAAYGQARAILEDAPDPTALGFWSANMGDIALRQGRLDEAAALLADAQAWLAEGQPTWYSGHALALLGSVAARRGDLDGAERWLTAAFPELRRYGAIVELIEGFEELARVVLERGDPVRSVEVLGAAEALRERTGRAAAAERRRELRSLLDGIHRRLPPARFDAAWERGRELSLDEAIALASVPREPVGPPAGPSGAEALTPRERQVAVLIAAGLTNAVIARELGISTGTARIHVERILDKLGFTSRVQIATWAIRAGLPELDPHPLN